MPRRSKGLFIPLLLLAACALAAAVRGGGAAEKPALPAVLLAPGGASDETLRRLRREDGNAVALNLAPGERLAVTAAVERVKKAGLGVYYWIEVGRNPAMADAHPQWMASLQGHPEWRRHFPKTPQPT